MLSIFLSQGLHKQRTLIIISNDIFFLHLPASRTENSIPTLIWYASVPNTKSIKQILKFHEQQSICIKLLYQKHLQYNCNCINLHSNLTVINTM